VTKTIAIGGSGWDVALSRSAIATGEVDVLAGRELTERRGGAITI